MLPCGASASDTMVLCRGLCDNLRWVPKFSVGALELTDAFADMHANHLWMGFVTHQVATRRDGVDIAELCSQHQARPVGHLVDEETFGTDGRSSRRNRTTFLTQNVFSVGAFHRDL